MNDDSLNLNLPSGPGLPPPPPLDLETIWELQNAYLAEFYQSPHYEAWYRRTSEEMRRAEPFVM